MKKLFAVLAVALIVPVMVSCNKDKRQEQGQGQEQEVGPFSPSSLEDYYGTVWTSEDGTRIFSFNKERSRAYNLNESGKIISQWILDPLEFEQETKGVRFVGSDNIEIKKTGTLSFPHNYLFEVGEENEASLYTCDDSWEKNVSSEKKYSLNKFDLSSLKFADFYRPKEEEAVDLGEMTSSVNHVKTHVKWAKWNLGADNEKGKGLFYAWGELEEKNVTSEDNYLYKDNPIDVLPFERDAARVRLGEPWRIPTFHEICGLFRTRNDTENYSWTYETVGGVNGWRITRLTGDIAGNNIFLPLAGYNSEWGLLRYNESGNYGCSSISSYSNAETYEMQIYPETETSKFNCWTGHRYDGLSIRPVCDL